MLQRLNTFLGKVMPLIAPISVVIGVLFADYLTELSVLVPWIFAFMTFAGSLSSNFHALQRAIIHPFPLLIAIFTLHIFMPLWALGIGHLTFHGDMFTITGLLLAMVIPTGITSFIWVSMYRGNIALTLSIILIDTILSPLIVPASLSLFVGEAVQMDVWNIMKGLIGMVVLPSIVGMSLNQLTKGKVSELLEQRLAPFSKFGLASVIMINSSVVAPYLSTINWKLILIGLVMFFIAFCGYLASWGMAKWTNRGGEVIIALTFTGGMRNISAGAVIAVTYFPPPVAVPVVIGMLFQQVLASIYGKLLNRRYNQPIYEQHYSA